MRTRVFWPLCVLLIFATGARAQKIDSLTGQLRTEQDHFVRLQIYNRIVSYYEFDNGDSALLFAKQGYKEFLNENYPRGMAELLVRLGGIYSEMGMFTTASKCYNEATPILRVLNDSFVLADVYNGLGVIDGRNGNFTSATADFVAALKVFEANNNQHGIASTYLKLGLVDQLTGNYQKALAYDNKALPIAEKTDPADAITLLNNMGTLYGIMKDTPTSISYYKKALRICQEPQYASLKVLGLTNLGGIYANAGKQDSALAFYNTAFQIAQKQHLPEDELRLVLSIATITRRTNPGAATRSVYDALQKADSLKLRLLETQILDELISVNKKEGNYKEVTRLLEKQRDVNDSLYNISKASEILDMQTSFEQSISNQKMAQLAAISNHEKEDKEIAILAALLLAAGLSGTLYFYIRQRKAYKIIRDNEHTLEQLNSMKDKLFSIIGHDLKNSIGSMPMLLDLYKTAGVSEEEKELFLNGLQINTTASLHTLDTLLHWGKNQIKGIVLKQVFFSVQDILQNKLQLLALTAELKGITMKNLVADKIVVYADIDHFRFIMRNLLSNAIKFTPEGGTIIMSADETQQDGHVVFAVSDSGIGMAEDQIKHIFDVANISTRGTANETGSSIGLMLCKEFIELNGGRIWVESTPGNGSTFYFTLKTKEDPEKKVYRSSRIHFLSIH